MGVTGTKGKSTTLELINSILESEGKKTALLSSIRFKIGDEVMKNTTSMTMPGRFFIQKFLRRAVNSGCQYAIIEVTSQGILQYRHRFIDWDAGLFLNLHPEHIEAHGSFEKYRKAKTKFFKYVALRQAPAAAKALAGRQGKQKTFFINEGDQNHQHFAEAINGSGGKIVYFSRESFIEKELNRGKESIGDWLGNNFNLENAAAATSFAVSQGISWERIKKVLENFKGVPGRMEYICEEPFSVVIDYAHTPTSLEKVYESLSHSEKHKGKLICVLGAAGGGRDKWKRPVIGKIASQYCQKIILTNEDPYDENPMEIISEIKKGIEGEPEVLEILDRREAIKEAINSAKKGDTVIITGKGSEVWLHEARGKKIPWNERQIVEELL